MASGQTQACQTGWTRALFGCVWPSLALLQTRAPQSPPTENKSHFNLKTTETHNATKFSATDKNSNVFTSKRTGRGVSPEAHYPWLQSGIMALFQYHSSKYDRRNLAIYKSFCDNSCVLVKQGWPRSGISWVQMFSFSSGFTALQFVG